MPKKTILFVNHEGHQYDPEYGTLWSDTWAEFKVRRSKSDPSGSTPVHLAGQELARPSSHRSP